MKAIYDLEDSHACLLNWSNKTFANQMHLRFLVTELTKTQQRN